MKGAAVIFRQLFGPLSCTYAYLPGCEDTGQALLIDGCGRTDFQDGDADAYRRGSSIAQERKRNPRPGAGRTLAQFTDFMANLDLPYPKFIDFALPGNRQCGVCPDYLPGNLEKYCRRMSESLQG